MNKYKHLLLLLILSIGVSTVSFSQDNEVAVLNQVIAELIGRQDNPDIPTYESLKQICRSTYISCDKEKKIIGLDFQFSNLNGQIPESISQLENLEYINVEYNYLKGPLPASLAQLQNFEELSARGNFLTGPLPEELTAKSGKMDIDLSQNIIKIDNKKIVRKFNIIDQVNLEGCRSPDSIYLSKHKSLRREWEEIVVDTAGIKSQEIQEEESDNTEPQDSFKIIETMPRFPGCEDQELADKEKNRCAQEKMLQFIYKNLKYPAFDRKMSIEGMVITQFVVLEDGSIGDVTLVKSPRGRMGNSGLWIMNRMNYICEKWAPGTQRGKNVKVLYTLPIKFKLQ